MARSPVVTAQEAARLLHLHVNTVKRTDPAVLPYFTVGTRRDRRYAMADIRAYIAARTVSK